MPRIYTHKCSACTFSLAAGWGGGMYVEDESGNRVRCGHPGEHFTVAKLLGIPHEEVWGALFTPETTPFESHAWITRHQKNVGNTCHITEVGPSHRRPA